MSGFAQWWIVGVILAILADLFTNIGTNLQKLAHTKIDEDFKRRRSTLALLRQSQMPSPVALQSPDSGTSLKTQSPKSPGHFESPTESAGNNQPRVSRTPNSVGTAPSKKQKPGYCSSPIWILGVALLILGAVGDFLALGFAAQSVVAPLGSLTLVVNMFMARWMHGERITPLGVVATVCIIAGSMLTIAFANHNNFELTVEQIFEIYQTPRFLAYIIVIAVGVAAMWISVRKWDKDPRIREKPHFPMYRLFFAALNGTIGGHNVLFAKFTVEIFARGQAQAFTYGLFYLTLFLMISTVLTQVKWLNEGLQRFDAIYVVPVSTAFWLFFSVFSGLITFAEYKMMTWFEMVYFTIGIMLVIIGVLVFTRTKTSSSRRSVIIDRQSRQFLTKNLINADGIATEEDDKGTSRDNINSLDPLNSLDNLNNDVIDSSTVEPVTSEPSVYNNEEMKRETVLEKVGLVKRNYQSLIDEDSKV